MLWAFGTWLVPLLLILGAALRVPWLVTLGRDEAWLALAVWAAVSLAMTPAAPPRR